MDDAWELHHFGSLTAAGAGTDYDKDGYSDKQEYLNELAGEIDPDGTAYDPNEKNAPNGTGWKNSAAAGASLQAVYQLLLNH
uniref:hypothetical protein n=1 Tax=Candidatus Electronema sp. TaxID=2698783 RepID=UPI0040562F54